MNDTRTDQVADLIVQLYTTSGESIGGMLHVQLDDGNIENYFWEDPFPDWLIKGHEREPLGVEIEIVELMRSMSITQRRKALGKANRKMSQLGNSRIGFEVPR